MGIVTNLQSLDYTAGGYPFLVVPAKASIDPDGLDLAYGGAPFFASLGEESTSIMRATQVVTEYLRDATDAGGGNLRVTEVATEWLIANTDNIYITDFTLERLSKISETLPPGQGTGKSWMVFDEVNHLDIYLSHGPVPTSAASKVAVLNGANLALWGSELIGFRDVASLGSNRYRLSMLLRGRWGTEWAMNTHQLNDPFILLSLSTVRRVTQDSVDLNVNKFYRGVTIGQNLQQAMTRGFANTGAGLKPYAPCHIVGSRDGSNNLTVTWVRRTRYSGEWMDVVEVGLGEDTEAYEVDVLNGAGTVVRTITGLTTASASYTAAQQTTDFGGTQAAIAIIVYQLSGLVGRGYGASVVV